MCIISAVACIYDMQFAAPKWYSTMPIPPSLSHTNYPGKS